MTKLKSLFRYVTFGLRTEWIKLFFETGINAVLSSPLGPKQKEALYRYLQDSDLIVDKQEMTPFYYRAKEIYGQKGIHSALLWSLLWINLSFHASLFNWWGTLKTGSYSRQETIDLLAEFYGKKNSSIVGAYTSLISTFERTPIGTELKIGHVTKDGQTRIIHKDGGFAFQPAVVLYAVYKYAEQSGQYRINLDEIADSPYSPQKILVLSSEAVKDALLALFEPEFLTVDVHDDTVMFLLNDQKSSLEVLTCFS